MAIGWMDVLSRRATTPFGTTAMLQGQHCTQQRSGCASTSGRGAEATWPCRRRTRASARGAAAEGVTTWPSGFATASPSSPQLRFLDLDRMRDVYHETVFPQHATSQASSKRAVALRQQVDACKDVSEVCSLVHSDAALMDPDTVLHTMKAICMLLPASTPGAAATAARKPLFQQQQGGSAAEASPSRQNLDLAMTELVAQLVAELPRVQVACTAAAINYLCRSNYPLHDQQAVSNLLTLLNHGQSELFLAAPRTLAQLAQGLGYLRPAIGSVPEAWLQAFCTAAQSRFPAMGFQQLSKVAWGVASLGHQPDPFWLNSFLARTLACRDEAKIPHISNLAWALLQFNKMAMGNARWRQEQQRYQRLVSSPLSLAAGEGGQQAHESVAGDDWVEACWEAVARQMEGMRPAEFAILMHSLSFLGPRPGPATMAAIYEFIGARAEGFSPAQDCQVLCALSRWKSRPSSALMAAMATHVQRRLPQHSPSDLHQLLGALSHLQFLPPRPWLAAWFTCARPKLRHFGTTGIVTVFRSFSFWGLCPPKEFVQDMLHLAAGLARAREFSPSELARVIRGVADLRLELPTEMDRPPRWSREVLHAFAGMSSGASAADLALVLYCLPHLLQPRKARSVAVGFEQPAAGAAPEAASSSSSDDPSAAGEAQDGDSASSSSSSASSVGGIGGSSGIDLALLRSSPALDSHVLPSVATIMDAAGPLLGSMTGPQLGGMALGLAGVNFPASPSFLDAHSRAVSERLQDLSERQIQAVERSYVRMRSASVRVRQLREQAAGNRA